MERFIEREAARLTTKCTINYCRVKAGANAKKLFGEAAFGDALEICRWEAYALILGDFMRVAEAHLRQPAGTQAEKVADRLVKAYGEILMPCPRPGNPDAGWAGTVEELRTALARARMAEPIPSYEIGRASGRIIYDAMPIHKSLRREDAEVVINQVRFGMVSLQQELERRLDVPAVLADYLTEDA